MCAALLVALGPNAYTVAYACLSQPNSYACTSQPKSYIVSTVTCSGAYVRTVLHKITLCYVQLHYSTLNVVT